MMIFDLDMQHSDSPRPDLGRLLVTDTDQKSVADAQKNSQKTFLLCLPVGVPSTVFVPISMSLCLSLNKHISETT